MLGASIVVRSGTVTPATVALASAIGCRTMASGARPRTNNARARAQPWVASLGTPQSVPFRKTGASLADVWAGRQTRQAHLHNLSNSLANFPVRAFDRLERVVVLGMEMANGPALAAEHHGFGLGPEVVIDDAVKELAVGDPGRGKGHVVAADQVIDRIDPSHILEAGRAGLLLLVARSQPEAALEIPAQAFERAGGEHGLRQTADADHHVDSGPLQGGHDRGRDVAVAEERDSCPDLTYLVHQRFMARTVEHDHGQVGDLNLLGEGDALQVVLHRIRDIDRAAC